MTPMLFKVKVLTFILQNNWLYSYEVISLKLISFVMKLLNFI